MHLRCLVLFCLNVDVFSGLLRHFFLLDLMVNNVTGGKLAVNVFQGNSRLDHQNHHMVGKIGDLVDRFRLVLSFCGNDDLGGFLAHLFQDLIQALFKKVRGVGAFFFVDLSALDQLHQAAK